MNPQAQAPPPPPGFVPMSTGGGDTPPPPPGFVAQGAQPTPPRPQPAQDAILADMRTNPRGEGTYQMQGPQGPVAVPFSHVKATAGPAGWQFANDQERTRYEKDYRARPVGSLSQFLQGIDEQPGWMSWVLPTAQTVGEMHGVASTVKGVQNIMGMGKGPAPEGSAQGFINTMADHQNANLAETAGDLGENAGEFVSGQELMGLLGGAVKGSQALTEAGKVSQVLEKYPAIARVLKVGMNAVKNIPELGHALLGAGQTYVKTGGDAGAALASGLETGAAGGVMRLGGAGLEAAKTAIRGPEAAAAATGPGAAEYADVARDATRPHLEQTNAARNVPQQEVLMNQPGGQPAAPTGRMVATATGKPAPPQINVDKMLNHIHDFTGAADKLTELNDDVYNRFDAATGGRFRTLNAEIAKARGEARRGVAGAAELYQSKLGEMDSLMSSDIAGGEMTPELKAAAKSGFRQSYVLRDFGDIWDRNMNGVPGGSQASQVQRGINGKGLMRDLQVAVKRHGRAEIEAALGPGRLESLERIADANQTAAGRSNFNHGVQEVVKHMAHGATLGGIVGHFVGSWPVGAAVGASTSAVFDAIKANPRIAQNFLFALESGANAERYGPFIANMIQKANTDDSREQGATK